MKLVADVLSGRADHQNRDTLSEELRSHIRSLDGQYLKISEDAGDEHQAIRLFSQARVASAWLFTLSGEYDEAIYEAISASDDPTTVLERVTIALAFKS